MTLFLCAVVRNVETEMNILAEAARCFQLHIKEQRSFIMNLNSWNYISRVVNLLMAFLHMPPDNPSHS